LLFIFSSVASVFPEGLYEFSSSSLLKTVNCTVG